MVAVVLVRTLVRVEMRAEPVLGRDALDVGGEVRNVAGVFVVGALEFCHASAGAGGYWLSVAAFAGAGSVLEARDFMRDDTAPLAEEWGEAGTVFVGGVAGSGVPWVGVGGRVGRGRG